jgi:hypothetical protein
VRVAGRLEEVHSNVDEMGLMGVELFGPSNEPSHFSRLMMDVSDYIDKFVLVFLDDILIYSMTEE